MRLKATKTSLYKLVTEYSSPPVMKKTEFVKSFRSPAYWLKWKAGGVDYSVYLTACMGLPLIAIGAMEYDAESGRHETVSCNTHTLTVEDLRGRGMIEE